MTANVTVVDHPLVAHKLSLMRERDTSSASFRRLSREIGLLLGYEVLRDLPTELRSIDTPLARMDAPFIKGKKLVFVPILRAAMGLLDGLLDLVPNARVGHIGIYRDPETLTAVEYYFKAPDDIADRPVVVVGSLLASGNSAIAAVGRVKELGAHDIKFVCLLSAPEGLDAFGAAHPDVPVFTAAIDQRLDPRGFILPGIGDVGDRMYGTR